ncbi:Helix-turn-helix domain protein [Mycolicibacterium aurum]|uniref:Helix-turn-helix domain protein n=2 Tax=Mycolicibacterium aurum TaxID=1791 RepID=A0A3S5EJ92_MYCAU|nr:Helix-turn-helix domain protein [Mycolicibacterium aurum]
MLAGIARGLRFSGADRDRLFSAAGYGAGFVGTDRLDVVAHVEPGLMHVLDRLADTPALVIDPLGRVLRQTPPATVLFGQLTFHTGWERSSYYRWFTGGGDRRSFTAGEQASIGTEIAADLRRGIDVHGCDQAAQLVTMLRRRSPEFTALWQRSPGTVRPARPTHLIHPELGGVCLQREVLSDTEAGQRLVVYAAEPGSESQDTLRLVSVLGHHRFHM